MDVCQLLGFMIKCDTYPVSVTSNGGLSISGVGKVKIFNMLKARFLTHFGMDLDRFHAA